MAISYDPPAVLSRFARERGITFPLLSDAGSATIDAWGVRNQTVRGGRLDGIPHPGTVLLDGEGVVRARLFHQGYEERHTAAEILAAAGSGPRGVSK